MSAIVRHTNKMTSLPARHILLIGFSAFAILFWFWHFSSPKSYIARLPYSTSHGDIAKDDGIKKPYWSMAGSGPLEGLKTFKKPDGLKKISALIFYGRPPSVSILDCYLKRNLVKNGGMLDEVIWVARTTKAADLAWLDVLLKTEPAYKRWNVTWEGNDYRSAYDRVEDGTMYIKIDDDIVFFEDSVIPTIVDTKWRHPEYFIVSANIMNSPSLSWVHYHLDAVHPYLPELNAMPNGLEGSGTDGNDIKDEVDWRASSLPTWNGPEDFNMTMDWTPTHEISQHRWLPLRPDFSKANTSMPQGLESTPIQMAGYDPFSNALWHWTLAAQQHYSFFQNLEENELWRYKFHTWNYNYTRMGVQMVAIMGDDINAGKPMVETDDEYYFTQVLPGKLKRRAVVDGRAVAAHYSFQPQKNGMDNTDVLARYSSFAKDHICTAGLV